MFKKIIFFLFLFLLIFSQNSFAINMKKNYRISQEKIDSLFAPAMKRTDIFSLYSKTDHKAPYLKSDIIFVKEGLRNLGKYKWIKKYNAYANTKNKRALFFKKNKSYLISVVKKKNDNSLDKKLKDISKNKISKKRLKDVFKIFTNGSLKKEKLSFYDSLVKKLKKEKLLYLRDKEYILLIDKAIQKSYVLQYLKKNNSLEYIGGDSVSTGNSSLNTRNSRFVDTPIGIINRKLFKRGDWRADKTNFSEYGRFGNRVFYLGKYIVPIEYNSNIKRVVHLAIHSTNPIDLKLLGHKASKGCIRISDNFNKILRKTALIDGKNGKYVIIVDSKLSVVENIKRVKEFFTYKKSKKRDKKYAMK